MSMLGQLVVIVAEGLADFLCKMIVVIILSITTIVKDEASMKSEWEQNVSLRFLFRVL